MMAKILVSLACLISICHALTVWPKPQQMLQTATLYQLASPPQFLFQVTGQTSTILSTALYRYQALIFYGGDDPVLAPKVLSLFPRKKKHYSRKKTCTVLV
jgi:hypothetical protein